MVLNHDFNKDLNTIKSFGDEWTKYDQSKLTYEDSLRYFNEYFDIFPWHKITKSSIGFDMGCGTGRWAKHMANKVKLLNCIEPSEALKIAKKNLINFKNIILIKEMLIILELKMKVRILAIVLVFFIIFQIQKKQLNHV